MVIMVMMVKVKAGAGQTRTRFLLGGVAEAHVTFDQAGSLGAV